MALRVRRRVVVVALCVACVTAWYAVDWEGEIRPVDPSLVVLLTGGQGWYVQPSLVRRDDEPGAVFVVPAALPGVDGLFEAIRVDMRSKTQKPVRIGIGPTSAYRFFDSADAIGLATARLRGLRLRRPVPHLFVFPGGGGPGFHFVDSATGVVCVVTTVAGKERTLFSRVVVNSARLQEMMSVIWVDKSRELLAVFWRQREGWTLYLFSLRPGQTTLRDGSLQ